MVPGIDEQLIIDLPGTGLVLPAQRPPEFLAGRRLARAVDHPGVPGLLVELEDDGRVVRQRDDLKPGAIKAGGGADDAPGLGQILLRSGLNGHEGQACDQERKQTLFHSTAFGMGRRK